VRLPSEVRVGDALEHALRCLGFLFQFLKKCVYECHVVLPSLHGV
jgi:hypothetical protein